METSVGLEKSMEELRQTFISGRTRSVAWRKSQIRGILKLLQEHEEGLLDSLHQDLGKHPLEGYRDEIGVLKKSADYTLSCLEQWMAPKRERLPWLFFPSRAEVLPEPLGLVLIFSSWNFPLSLALDPMIGAISAGNTVVLKPSELAPACSAYLANVIPLYLDNDAIKVVEGGTSVGEQLLEQRWDKIFFTGSPRVGRIIMSAAAKHLTPVTLELGGKCPLIFDFLSSNFERQVAIQRIVAGKWGLCSGQACISIDYLIVEEKWASTLIDLLRNKINKFYGNDPNDPKRISRIVNKHHFRRLQNLLQDPGVKASIVHGGSLDEDKLFIEPTILLNPPLEAEIMTEEIFGPLLPVITLKNIQESIKFVNSRPKPLAMYVFTKDEDFKRRVISETSSGSVTFNDVVFQFLCDQLPFGGVGESGFGAYHGKYSFETFSHKKAVLQRGFWPEMSARYPPWNDFKFRFVRLGYSFDYLGLFLLLAVKSWLPKKSGTS